MRRQIVIMLLGLMTTLSLSAFAIAGSRNTNGHETTRQDFFAYDRRGNLLSTAIGGGMPTAYRWNTESSTLAAALAGGRETASERADSVMTTFYTYEPLVGCTGITRPDGRHTGYDYQGGRLSEITNNRAKVSHLPFYRLFQMIVSCNLQINNSLTFCKRKLMLYINSLLQHLMVTKQVGLLQAHQQSVYLPSNSPWYQPH